MVRRLGVVRTRRVVVVVREEVFVLTAMHCVLLVICRPLVSTHHLVIAMAVGRFVVCVPFYSGF